MADRFKQMNELVKEVTVTPGNLMDPPHHPFLDFLMEARPIDRLDALLLTLCIYRQFVAAETVQLADILEPFLISDEEMLEIVRRIYTLSLINLVEVESGYGESRLGNLRLSVDQALLRQIVSNEPLVSPAGGFFSIVESAFKLMDARESREIPETVLESHINASIRSIADKHPTYEVLAQGDWVNGALLFSAVADYVKGGTGVYLSRFASSIAENMSSQANIMRRAQEGKMPVLEAGWVELKEGYGFHFDPEIQLSRKAARILFATRKEGPRFEPRLVQWHKFAKLKKTEPRLFFPQPLKGELDSLSSAIQGRSYRRVSRELKKAGFPTGLVMLFYGEPGTGKTAAVMKMAVESRRDVLQVDNSVIRDKYVGESEKRLRSVFAEYEEARTAFRNTPILLFNEADALIGTRVNVADSVDAMNNTMQNILLEQLETFEGILIATTNLMTNMDNAFTRRFLYKIKFEMPGKSEREQIWKTRLPELSRENARELGKWALTGSQIDIIARQVLVDQILSDRRETVAEIENRIRKELGYRRDGAVSIGFRERGLR